MGKREEYTKDNHLIVSADESVEYVGAFWAGGYDTSTDWIDVDLGCDPDGRYIHSLWSWIDVMTGMGAPDAVLVMCGDDVMYFDVWVDIYQGVPDTCECELVEPHKLDAFVARKMIENDYSDTRVR